MKERQDSKKTVLEYALEYDGLGLCVIPIKPRSKKPAVRSWKPYQTKRPDDKQLRKWFAKNDRNIAVVLGPVSGDLACRDYDAMAEYKRWAKAYPDLTKTLPTVKTSKGMHVYFQAEVKGRIDIEDANGNHLGELRGSGHYCLLPPSVHPDGPAYEWANPLTNGNLLAVDPELAGFLEEKANVTEQVKQAKQLEQPEQLEQSEAIYEGVSVGEIDASVKKAISETIPHKVGTRNRQVWQFIRTLKTDPCYADANPVQLRPIVKLWHEEALPHIRTKDFDETWTDFLYGWERDILPLGEDPMKQLFERAKNGPMPEVALRYDKPKVRLLVAWCRKLQSEAGRHPFYLSTRTAGKYLEVEPMTAWRYMYLLIQEQVLQEVEKGKMTRSGGVATRFRYIAN